ncbi:asparagine synthase (glutamine-hydrolyzing) [Streptomyces viridosporus]|uniref:asparagine synthase (glutamine-hydrolyzing) n=1 Tax=Streptomyces viridosporus T7A TaxID=665577 RepID=A0ABX6A9Z8_STRVD|nr:asparagine synthase (glutamine-hydrolyzing) [Streptomyces viridosporus]QEU83884.1 asparagine synthase (glutamine-hydrolyzing) [Streptomyces viridosporus T7A]
MCGIAGWVDWNQILKHREDVIAAMTETMAPRGPDAQGTWLSDHAALGHRRLAVIDIEGGRQPMVRTGRGGGQVVVTFSGEIYNFRELRAELRSHGAHFSTRSDTEVLLAAYLHWGADFVHRLNGMYAFALWDERTRELLLVRDRLGIKPLYYAPVGDGIVFGSEPKALLAHPGMVAEVDREGIAELFVLPRAKTPGHGVYRTMREVKPGCVVIAGPSGRRERRYWQLEARPHTDDFATTAAEVRSLLRDTVQRQVVADVPVGTLLSGGIDSSAITALAVQELDAELASYSVNVGTSERPGSDTWRPSADEPFARLVAERLGIKRFVADVGADDLVEGIDSGLRARDLPGWGDLDTSMYHLFRRVQEQCTVALSGEAADEMFGGYAWQLDSGYVGHASFPWMYAKRQPALLLRDDVRAEIEPARYEAERYRQALAEVPRLPGEDGARRREREVFHLGLSCWLGALLDRKDRMSMAVGLEVRVPFADHRLAEYLFNVPLELKAYGGTEKALLRRACADLLPREVVERPKSAYPASRDTGYVERLRGLVLDMVGEPNAPVFDLMDRAKVRAAVTSGLDSLPGPITAVTPAIGLSYLLQLNRWLELYGVRIAA